MVPKRKRNVKIDTTVKYQVVNIEELDPNHLEEFTLPPLDTGMEAEEEKEIHLKKIIDSGSGSIPIPIILKIENPAKEFYEKKNLETRYINWSKDVKNHYYMETKDYELCETLGITEEEYRSVCDEIEDDLHVKIENEDRLVETRSSSFNYNSLNTLYPPASQSKLNSTNDLHSPQQESSVPDITTPIRTEQRAEVVTPEPSTFLTPMLEENHTNSISEDMKRRIKTAARYKRLIRDEDKSHPSYVCFRRRVLKPSRKNRRSEGQTIEKVVRLNSELWLLTKLSELRKEVCELNDKMFDINFEIAKGLDEIVKKFGEKGQKKVARLLRKSKQEENKSVSSQQGDIFKDILFDRDRIRVINKRLRLARENIDEEEIEREAKGYTNYLRRIHGDFYLNR